MLLQIRHIKAEEDKKIKTISVLANTILHEFYGPQMPSSHIDFFLDSFQSVEAIQDQIKNGWEYFIIDLNEVPIGYLGLEFKDDKMIISKLYVLANQRNAGAGKAAIRHALERAEYNKSSIVELNVNTENKRAVKFYERYGFNMVDEIHNTYENGHTEIDFLMQKDLTMG